MAMHMILCSGDHTTTPVLGKLELPDDLAPAAVAAALAGHLCEDCGTAYNQLTAAYADGGPGLPPRTIPQRDAVDAALRALGRTRKGPR